MTPVEDRVLQALRTVIEPELNQDIITLDMVRDLVAENGVAAFTIVLTTPACPLKDVFVERCNAALIGKVEGISEVRIKWDAQVPTDRRIHGRSGRPDEFNCRHCERQRRGWEKHRGDQPLPCRWQMPAPAWD